MAEAAPDWWQTWFGPGYLAVYDDYLAERTPVEVDQIEALLRMKPPRRVLDLPCGQGRHSIELARRGYDVTGVDLSPFMLDVARTRAAAAGIQVRWLEGDMRRPPGGGSFDVILNLFTSFGYFADPADDQLVLTAGMARLAPGGRLLLEVINGTRIMNDFQSREWFTIGRAAVMEARTLDRSSQRMVVERTVSIPPDEETTVHALRLYTGEQLEAAMRSAGFGRVALYGDWDGGPLRPDSLRLLALGSREP